MPGDDPIAQLIRLRAKSPLVVAGLISGTSADAVDAAVVVLEVPRGRLAARLLAFHEEPIPADVRRRVLEGAALAAAELARLDVELGALFAKAALAAIAAAGLEPGAVDLIGSHGQTIHHAPPAPGAEGCSLQIGQAAVIAARTGIPVIADFRRADLARGGHGAPLVPLVDHLLFAVAGETRVLLNIGGIANITITDGRLEQLLAYDTGPGNALLDALVRLASGGAASHDRDGAGAAAGVVQDDLLAELLEHPFFNRPPPRSADRDTFGAPLARRLLASGRRLEDLLATAAAFTARSIAREVLAPHAQLARPRRVIASGGGVRNRTLMAELRDALGGVPLEASDAHGVPADAKEAVAFAVLARQSLLGRQGNVPSATGAREAAVLGAIAPAGAPRGGAP